jgi:hypothetical protein
MIYLFKLNALIVPDWAIARPAALLLVFMVTATLPGGVK